MKNLLTKASILLLLAFSSCMDEDINMISDSVNTEGTYAIPLIHSTTDLLDLLPENEDMLIDPDNAIRIVYRQDSIAEVMSDSLLNIEDQAPTTEMFDVGPIELSTFESQMEVQMGSLVSNLTDQTLASQINEGISYSEEHGSAYFPPISPQSGGSYLAQGSDEFEHIYISSGEIQLEITNNLAVEISSLTLMLRNEHDQSQLGTFMFNNIAVGEMAVSSIPLNGVTMYSDLEMDIISISSPGSGPDPFDQSSWVPMANTDELSIEILGQNMVASSGSLKYPERVGPSDLFEIDMEFEDDVEISFIDLSAGEFVYTYTSDVNTNLELTITIPQLVDATSNPFVNTIILQPTLDPVTISTPIDAYNFDFSDSPNLVEVNYSTQIMATTSYVEYNMADAINLSIGMQNLDFDLVEGYFGQTEQVIEEDVLDIDVSALEDIASGIQLESPTMRLTTSNSMDIPFEINLDITGYSETDQVSLGGPALQIDADAITISEYNNSNSQLSDLIALSPNEIVYSGSVLSNPLGQTLNSISPNTSISIDMEMDLPLHMRIEDALTTDTLALEFGGEQEEDIDFIESVQLKLHTENEFPMDIAVTMYFTDSISGAVHDSLVFDLLQAAEVDENGRTIQAHVYDSSIGLDSDQIDALFNSNQALLDIKLNSYDYENSAIRLYTDYQFVISAGVLLEFKLEE